VPRGEVAVHWEKPIVEQYPEVALCMQCICSANRSAFGFLQATRNLGQHKHELSRQACVQILDAIGSSRAGCEVDAQDIHE
jgi:hypothetical protein